MTAETATKIENQTEKTTTIESDTLEQVLNVTDNATKKVSELLQDEEEAMALRIAVKPGGCSGLSYEMYFDAEFGNDDIVQQESDIKVVIDSASSQYLKGATLDYKDGLQGAGFAIDNPNVTRSCGCGNSFS